MYPEWPEPGADLVPLPQCDGPKLKPFDFQGPQNIEFLEYLGEGSHSHVVKVKIQGRIYALKLVSYIRCPSPREEFELTCLQFRFVYDHDWFGPTVTVNHRETMSAFYNYAEPFSCECRAFGRLQEAGHSELAVKCFGYLLLTEENERALLKELSHVDLEFNGSYEESRRPWNMRERFLGKGGIIPPIRGILKEFGQSDEPLRTKNARTILRDIIRIQQLGIFGLDLAHRQLINGKISDLSTALTVPHFFATPELNPHITPEWKSAMEFQTFRFAMNDYWAFDNMIEDWNREHENWKEKVSVCAFPGGHGCSAEVKYNLRSGSSREKIYTLVDPRLYDWKSSVTPEVENHATGVVDGRRLGRKAKGGSHGKQRRGISKARRRLESNPPKWYCDKATKSLRLERYDGIASGIGWEYRDGHIFPRETSLPGDCRLPGCLPAPPGYFESK